jgi:hypothetical protein
MRTQTEIDFIRRLILLTEQSKLTWLMKGAYPDLYVTQTINEPIADITLSFIDKPTIGRIQTLEVKTNDNYSILESNTLDCAASKDSLEWELYSLLFELYLCIRDSLKNDDSKRNDSFFKQIMNTW